MNLRRGATAAVIAAGAYIWFDGSIGAKRIARLRRRPVRRQQLADWAASALPPNSVVLVGDSHIARGAWTTLLEPAGISAGRVANRGIAGETTVDLLDRVADAVDGDTAAVVVAIGTNDLHENQAHAHIVRTFSQILDRVAAAAPHARVVVSGVPPRSDRYRTVVGPLNDAYRRVCANRDVAFVALDDGFDVDGRLDSALSDDGLHLNDLGYARWAERLAPALAADPQERNRTSESDLLG